ncbi:MAG TPA: NB-ARC domain-containing protein [Terracidiphilus sp.]|jgi:LuxR family glucitol operon transcriptional activator|nr:NB-ARC domain-containing protein [Terracidiphilus sp.]
MANTSAVRNTCFALLSAVEVDLRELIERELLSGAHGGDTIPDDVKQNAISRYSFDHKDSPMSSGPTDVDLLPYMDFADLAKVLGPAIEQLKSQYGDGISSVPFKIEAFAPVRNRVCHSRPLEEHDFPACLDFSKELLHINSSLPWATLRTTQRMLEENPGYVISLQIPEFWQIGSTRIRHNLPLPDYDETGFLGRGADRTAVRKHLLAAHPVITIVGEGGVGKSALAVQCLYDILSLTDNPPFEAIIWTSLKTKTLTASGVRDIKDSITSTLGIIENLAKELGAAPPESKNLESAIQEIVDYLSLFKILLVIDNYETVTDNSLRPLLTSVPAGSKILLTSRVGLGELEIRYKLDPMDLKTSVALLRRFSRSLNIELLYAAGEKKLERYSQQLYYNPLLIKWFAQSVSLGSDPEKLIAKRNAGFDEVLKYCFENLFARLDSDEKRVLHLLAAARRPLTPTELLFLMQGVSQIEPIDVDRALSTLHSSSMLKRSPVNSKSRDGGIQLSLTDVASDYISRFAPPDKAIFEKVQQASRKLSQQIQLSSVRQAAYKFDLHAVRASTRDERIAAYYLNNALDLSRSRNFNEARKNVATAKELLPTFAEAYRVSSLVEGRAEETYKALQEIEEAVQLAPESVLIRYQFANFLVSALDDYERALVECDAGISRDSDETLITLRALILTRLGRYSEAAPIYESVLGSLALRPTKWRISTRDQAAECYRRFGEQDRVMKNGTEFRNHIERACAILEEAMALGDFDRSTGHLYTNIIEDALHVALREFDEPYAVQMLARLSDAANIISVEPFRVLTKEKLETTLGENSAATNAFKEYIARFERQEVTAKRIEAESQDGHLVGRFRSASNGRRFGFVIDGSGTSWFLIPSSLSGDWEKLRDGMLVRFAPELDAQGRGRASEAVILT